MTKLNFEKNTLRARVREEYRLYGPLPESESSCPASYGPLPPKLHFVGSFKSLRLLVRRTGLGGTWSEAGRVKVYRTDDRGIMNWAPSTGNIWFQGKRPFLDDLHAAMVRVLPRFGRPHLTRD
jgi:hypothetical protein